MGQVCVSLPLFWTSSDYYPRLLFFIFFIFQYLRFSHKLHSKLYITILIMASFRFLFQIRTNWFYFCNTIRVFTDFVLKMIKKKQVVDLFIIFILHFHVYSSYFLFLLHFDFIILFFYAFFISNTCSYLLVSVFISWFNFNMRSRLKKNAISDNRKLLVCGWDQHDVIFATSNNVHCADIKYFSYQIYFKILLLFETY